MSAQPFALGDRVSHVSRGAGTVRGVLRQTYGAQLWICWVEYDGARGEHRAVCADELVGPLTRGAA